MSMTDVAAKYVQKTITKLNNAGYAPVAITVSVDRLRPGVAGMAWPAQRRIVISKDYLHEFPHEVQDETIPHEVCHVYQEVYYPNAKQRHGPEFRRLMNLIGCEGKTRHTMLLSQGPTRRANRKVRFVYHTVDTKREILLTRNQHTRQVNWLNMARKDVMMPSSLYTSKGESLVFSGKTRTIV